MKTRQLLFGVILGLLAAVHSIPLSTVSDIPAQLEEDVFAEAVTDGFLIHEPTSLSPTTESFKTNTTSQAPLLSNFVTEGSGEIIFSQWLEGSGEGPIGTSAVPTQDSSLRTESGENPETSETTQLPHLEITTVFSGTTSPFERMDGSGDDPIETSAAPIQDSAPPTESYQTTKFMMEESVVTQPSLFDSTTETSAEIHSADSFSDSSSIQTTHPESTPFPLLQRSFVKKSFEPPHDSTTETANQHPSHDHDKALPVAGHSRHDWLIIGGFFVGIVALIGLCVAVATRDEWNKNSSSSSDKNTNLLNQKIEQEMKTFLPKNEPKENGHNGEYTVIPLADIPEKYLSN